MDICYHDSMKLSAKPRHSVEIIAEPLPAVSSHTVIDHTGQTQTIFLVREQPLTIYLNRREIVTVMTMGAAPAYLIAGFLLNQQLIARAEDIDSIHVDWTVGGAAVYATASEDTAQRTEKRVVTSGCGQGTMFADVMENATQNAKQLMDVPTLTASQIYALLAELSQENEVYKKAGGVHSCALCTHNAVIKTVEDVGRHNAVDALSGYLALEPTAERPTIMYTTGRLTSEMVIKTAQMGIPIVISRSGATSMGLAVAEAAGITLISRAKGQRFLILTHGERVAI